MKNLFSVNSENLVHTIKGTQSKPLPIINSNSKSNLSYSISEDNINQQNDYNLIHNHGGRYHLSGTYYVRVPENSGRLVFRDPRPGQLLNNFMMERFDGNEIYHKNIHEGLLMIWPSYVDHFVEPNQTYNERISISFDITAK